MASEIAVRRLRKELLSLKKEPIKEPKITVAPNEDNILEMHYVIEGSKGTPYEGGVYHGKLVFPKEYPLRPPSVLMLTPSGRFQPNRRLCLSMSDFHPESWNPLWSVSTILTGLYSFMIETYPTLGSIETSTLKKRQLAAASLEYNCKQSAAFCKLFPEYVERYEEQSRLQGQSDSTSALTSSVNSSRLSLAGGNAPLHNHGGEALPQVFMATLGFIAAVLSILMASRFM